MNHSAAISALLIASLTAVRAAGTVDFNRQVRPILETYCLKCHGPEKPKGNLRLVTAADALDRKSTRLNSSH